MADRYAVRPATGDGGECIYWLVRVSTGERLISSVFADTLARLAAVMERRAVAEGRPEGGSW